MNFDKAMRSYCIVSLGLIGGVFVACAGSSTPATDDTLQADIATAFADGAGVAGGAGGAAAGAGGRASGGTGGRASGGSGGRASGGSAGSAQASEAGAGGSDASTGGTSSSGCNGFEILETRCSGGSCHGAGSTLGNFAESEEIAAGLADSAPVTPGCQSEDSLINTDNPRDSLLILKVNGTVPCGSAMPLIPPLLTDDEVDCLVEWIGGL
jgi:hypothetical protein